MVRLIKPGKQYTKPESERGFGYLMVLFLVMVMSVVLGVATENLDTALKREKEKDWVFIGKQYQQAITNYYHQSPNGFKALPESIASLLSDDRFIEKKHHLRKAFLDPMTNQPWQIIVNSQNKIIGVRSTSNETFQIGLNQLSALLGKKMGSNIRKYSDLAFEYQPNVENQNNIPTSSNLPTGLQ